MASTILKRPTLIAALSLVLVSGAAHAESPGVKVGEPAPRFSLLDQDRTERSLGDWLGKGPVAIVFYRSADW